MMMSASIDIQLPQSYIAKLMNPNGRKRTRLVRVCILGFGLSRLRLVSIVLARVARLRNRVSLALLACSGAMCHAVLRGRSGI